MKITLTALKSLAALAFAITPAVALAHPVRSSTPHVRPNLFHDRTPQIHEHIAVAHH